MGAGQCFDVVQINDLPRAAAAVIDQPTFRDIDTAGDRPFYRYGDRSLPLRDEIVVNGLAVCIVDPDNGDAGCALPSENAPFGGNITGHATMPVEMIGADVE